jgi:hypothetical protein
LIHERRRTLHRHNETVSSLALEFIGSPPRLAY